MKTAKNTTIALFLFLFLNINNAIAAPVLDPKIRIEYWNSNYTTVLEKDSPQVKTAQTIFTKILNAAGFRPGIKPRLHIIKENPYGISLPISIPDGWVILSQSVLDFCYRDKQAGDDRLAFVLAHEISHHLEGDFWHMKFFQAMGSKEAMENNDQHTLKQLREIIKDSNKILAKELRADELGIIYSMMAGYDPNAVIKQNSKDDFFTEWNNYYHPDRLKNKQLAITHPTVKQRVAAIRTRLALVATNTKLFDLGLWYYQSGDFSAAALAFEKFLKYYSGREVHHNLAVSYHQLVAKYYRSKENHPRIPYQLSLLIDPITNASRNADRSHMNVSEKFEYYFNEAIKNYKIAIALDPEYLPAYNNIASLYLLIEEPYKAISNLQDAEKLSPDNKALLNNLGVAYFQANNEAFASKYLRRAIAENPGYISPLYNSALIALRRGDMSTATELSSKYFQTDSDSAWAKRLANRLNVSLIRTTDVSKIRLREKIQGVEIGTYRDEIPKKWGQAKTQQYTLGELSHIISNYENVTTLYEGDEVRNIITGKNFLGKSGKGISIGSRASQVIGKYGRPDSIYWTLQGKTLSYANAGISFLTRADKVSGWILF